MRCMARPEPDDDDLLVATAAGDADAFAIFYRRHLDLVVAFLRPRVMEPEMAFDLSAETFAAAVSSAARYRPGQAPASAWLLGIARNKLLESLRRGRVEDQARRSLGLAPIALDDDDLRAVDERAEAGAAGLEALLAELPDATRAAVLGHVVEERSYPELAERLGCSEQVIRKRVSRGLQHMRARLKERG
jgi:RNA polymerase sigma factor (sigma-70 family)